MVDGDGETGNDPAAVMVGGDTETGNEVAEVPCA